MLDENLLKFCITFWEETGLREKVIMNYKDLEIWKLASEVAIEIHKLTISGLPAFEMYETGNQIRRSSKSVRANIVEGWARRRSKKEFLQFLRIAQASNDETLDHLETLFETGSLKDKDLYLRLHDKICHLGKKINRFNSAVEENHRV